MIVAEEYNCSHRAFSAVGYIGKIKLQVRSFVLGVIDGGGVRDG